MLVPYPDVVVLSKAVKRAALDQELLNALEVVPEHIGIKGGVAREMLKVALGIATTHIPEKIADLDLVVFEEPAPTREERIARRMELANQISGVEPKDLEFLPAGESGLRHYFITRDVTMNEVIVFKTEDGFKFQFTPECRDSLQSRVIKPSIHCAHSGLDVVWIIRDDEVVIDANIARRCIYRRIKGDGDRYDFEQFSMRASVAAIDDDTLFKISKRFIKDPEMFRKCCDALLEFGFSEESIATLVEMSKAHVDKPSKAMTPELIEDLLEKMQAGFKAWKEEHPEPCFHETANVVFLD